MADYLLVYHGGSMPESPEEGAKVMQAWTDWFTTIGAGAVKDQGNPTGATRTIAANGSVTDTANGPTGYTILQADSLEAAVELAKGCPVLHGGASIQVAETIAVM